MNFDLIIIGSGPGGYVAAIRASQLGMKVAVIEKEDLGGVCLNWGCIPTKALMKSAEVYTYLKNASDYGFNAENVSIDFAKIIDRSRKVAFKMSGGVNFLMKKNKIEVIKGTAKLLKDKQIEISSTEGLKIVSSKNIIIATGAKSRELPNLKQDGIKVINYRQALDLNKIPKSMLVVGSGAIGCEFAYFYATMGTEVTIVEYLDKILPNEDEEVSAFMEQSFKKKKINILTQTSLENYKINTNQNLVSTLKEVKTNNLIEIETEIILSAVGIIPNTSNLGLEEIGITLEQNGKIKVDEFCKTNLEGYFAIGDVTNGPALAHVASAEAVLCVENIAGLNPEPIDYNNIPSCTYTSPEVASIGLTEKKALELGHTIKVGKFPLSASGKANANGNTEGFIKVIFSEKYGEWLGCHIVGKGATELIAEALVARKLETTAHEIIKSIHPHPTLSEGIMEASANAYNEAIHI